LRARRSWARATSHLGQRSRRKRPVLRWWGYNQRRQRVHHALCWTGKREDGSYALDRPRSGAIIGSRVQAEGYGSRDTPACSRLQVGGKKSAGAWDIAVKQNRSADVPARGVVVGRTNTVVEGKSRRGFSENRHPRHTSQIQALPKITRGDNFTEGFDDLAPRPSASRPGTGRPHEIAGRARQANHGRSTFYIRTGGAGQQQELTWLQGRNHGRTRRPGQIPFPRSRAIKRYKVRLAKTTRRR